MPKYGERIRPFCLNFDKSMKQINSFKSGPRPGILPALLASVIFASSIAFVIAGDSKTPAAQTSDSKPVKKKLTGAELYQINCNRCHAERYPTEFTSAQWKTLITHMRVRAGIPAAQAREILKYLQEDSGN